MKKIFLLMIGIAFNVAAHAQKVEYQEAQTRVIEPLQDVYVRPLAADLELVKKERKTYKTKYYLSTYKLADIMASGKMDDILYQAKVLATYEAAKEDNADVIVAATYLVTHHKDEKGRVSEFGVDITVNGYPARYTNWHKAGDNPEDKEWIPNLLEGQRSRSYIYNANVSEQKKEAVKGK